MPNQPRIIYLLLAALPKVRIPEAIAPPINHDDSLISSSDI
ncbi:hypothetical protein ACOWPH_28930 (plasmid) [Anabaena sp. PCC 7938]|nr:MULTISPECIES: hypothetical protein [Anabaena]